MAQPEDSPKATLLIKRWQIRQTLDLIGTNELNLLLVLDHQETYSLSLSGQDAILEIPVEVRPYQIQLLETEGSLKSRILSITPKPGEKLYLRCGYDHDTGSLFGAVILQGLIFLCFLVISAISSHTITESPAIPSVKLTLRLERVKHEYDW